MKIIKKIYDVGRFADFIDEVTVYSYPAKNTLNC